MAISDIIWKSIAEHVGLQNQQKSAPTTSAELRFAASDVFVDWPRTSAAILQHQTCTHSRLTTVSYSGRNLSRPTRLTSTRSVGSYHLVPSVSQTAIIDEIPNVLYSKGCKIRHHSAPLRPSPESQSRAHPHAWVLVRIWVPHTLACTDYWVSLLM